jgi:hypothetical protein
MIYFKLLFSLISRNKPFYKNLIVGGSESSESLATISYTNRFRLIGSEDRHKYLQVDTFLSHFSSFI